MASAQSNGIPAEDPTLHLPRILCLHGGGVTAEIFRLQARSLIKSLPHFRLVFADGPFYCSPGPGIIPVYQDMGPYRRWLRWLPAEHPPIDNESASEEVRYSIETAKRRDKGSGEWVGVMGFSQGAKVASSLVYEQQALDESDGWGREGLERTRYRFAVLLAGRSPLVSFCESTKHEAMVDAGDVSEGFVWGDGVRTPDCILRVPTIHVHGLKDNGLHLHRRMLEQYHDPDTARVVEWEGEHRVPIKKTDVDRIVKEIYEVAREGGVEC